MKRKESTFPPLPTVKEILVVVFCVDENRVLSHVAGRVLVLRWLRDCGDSALLPMYKDFTREGSSSPSHREPTQHEASPPGKLFTWTVSRWVMDVLDCLGTCMLVKEMSQWTCPPDVGSPCPH